MTSTRREQIVASLQNKEYRDHFVAEEIDTGLAFQIRATRQARGWSQKELAVRAGMTQEAISRLESLSYGRFTLATLKRLASALDIALTVRFLPFSQLVDRVAYLSLEDLAVPDLEHDTGLNPVNVHIEPTQTGASMPPVTQVVVNDENESSPVDHMHEQGRRPGLDLFPDKNELVPYDELDEPGRRPGLDLFPDEHESSPVDPSRPTDSK